MTRNVRCAHRRNRACPRWAASCVRARPSAPAGRSCMRPRRRGPSANQVCQLNSNASSSERGRLNTLASVERQRVSSAGRPACCPAVRSRAAAFGPPVQPVRVGAPLGMGVHHVAGRSDGVNRKLRFSGQNLVLNNQHDPHNGSPWPIDRLLRELPPGAARIEFVPACNTPKGTVMSARARVPQPAARSWPSR